MRTVDPDVVKVAPQRSTFGASKNPSGLVEAEYLSIDRRPGAGQSLG
jgi:hypothetical protein